MCIRDSSSNADPALNQKSMHTRGNSLFSTKTHLGLFEWLKYLTSPGFIEILSLF